MAPLYRPLPVCQENDPRPLYRHGCRSQQGRAEKPRIGESSFHVSSLRETRSNANRRHLRQITAKVKLKDNVSKLQLARCRASCTLELNQGKDEES